jgi:hypothetical protein
MYKKGGWFLNPNPMASDWLCYSFFSISFLVSDFVFRSTFRSFYFLGWGEEIEGLVLFERGDAG